VTELIIYIVVIWVQCWHPLWDTFGLLPVKHASGCVDSNFRSMSLYPHAEKTCSYQTLNTLKKRQ